MTEEAIISRAVGFLVVLGGVTIVRFRERLAQEITD